MYERYDTKLFGNREVLLESGSFKFKVWNSLPSRRFHVKEVHDSADTHFNLVRSDGGEFNVSLLSYNAPHPFWRTKVVKVVNRYLIANQTDCELQWSQEGCGKDFSVKSREQSFLHWPSHDNPKLLQIKFKGQEWSWSYGFDVKDISLFEIKIYNADNTERTLIVQTTTEEATTAIIVRPAKSGFCSYLIKNDTSLEMFVNQKDTAEIQTMVLPGSESSYVWFDLKKRKLLCINIGDVRNVYLIEGEKTNPKTSKIC